MNAMNNEQPARRSCGGAFWMALLFLIIGLVVGVFGSKYYWQKSPALGANGTAPNADLTTLSPKPVINSDTASQWDPLRQMTEVQAEIDLVFQRSMARMNASPASAQGKPGYSLSMDVRDLKDKYEVCAFLPETKPADVTVNLKGDQLKVDMAKKIVEKPTAKNGETALSEWGNYEETVHLAGPLKDSQMKVERLPHELIITVPKA